MGMFDSIYLKCPECDTPNEFQTKSGDCVLGVYDEKTAPLRAWIDVNRHAPIECEKCSTPYAAEISISVKIVKYNQPKEPCP